jgi:hypothetical protein
LRCNAPKHLLDHPQQLLLAMRLCCIARRGGIRSSGNGCRCRTQLPWRQCTTNVCCCCCKPCRVWLHLNFRLLGVPLLLPALLLLLLLLLLLHAGWTGQQVAQLQQACIHRQHVAQIST